MIGTTLLKKSMEHLVISRCSVNFISYFELYPFNSTIVNV